MADGGFIFYFHPYLGKWSNLTNIFTIFSDVLKPPIRKHVTNLSQGVFCNLFGGRKQGAMYPLNSWKDTDGFFPCIGQVVDEKILPSPWHGPNHLLPTAPFWVSVGIGCFDASYGLWRVCCRAAGVCSLSVVAICSLLRTNAAVGIIVYFDVSKNQN